MKPIFCALFLLACLGVSPGNDAHGTAQTPAWISTGALNTGRALHTATPLLNGKVLVAGGCSAPCVNQTSAELYDPATGVWSATGVLAVPRLNHTAVRLANSKVLVLGGDRGSPSRNRTNSTELYDPETGEWTATGNLATARELATATLLPNGKVLVAGGSGPGNNLDALATAELYDPATGNWNSAGTLNAARSFHTATLLPNGKVLVAAGATGTFTSPVLHASAELYDPTTNSWTPTGSLGTGRSFHKAILLPNGKVLAVGGSNVTSTVYNSAELYDPATGQWNATGSMAVTRQAHTLVLLANGQALVAGKTAGLAGAELYDPATGSWRATANLTSTTRQNHTATLLANGKVLVTGGNGSLASTELYDSGTTAVASVSAASFTAGSAPEAMIAAFGVNLAPSVQTATSTPLPTELAGVSVRVRDSAGIERLAPLFFVAPTQINYLVPAGTAPGTAYVNVSSGAAGVLGIGSTAPGLFTANADGQSVAAAVALRVRGDGSQSYEAIARLEGGRFVAVPIDLGPASDHVFLVLYGTGIHAQRAISASLGGTASEVLFAGAVEGLAGLDQVNTRVPRTLAGRGELDVVLMADGRATNTVRINVR